VRLNLPENADGSFVTKGCYANVFLWDSQTFAPVADKHAFK